MLRYIVFVSLLVISGASFGAEVPVRTASDVPPGTELIKVATANELLSALNSVTGLHEETVGQGASQTISRVPYNFSTETLWALTDNISVLRKFITTVQETAKARTAQAQAKNGGPLKPKKEAVLDASRNVVQAAELSDAQIELDAELDALMQSEKPVAKLLHIKRSDLNLKENRIPGITLSVLAPIIDP
jgi:hypothetical protein